MIVSLDFLQKLLESADFRKRPRTDVFASPLLKQSWLRLINSYKQLNAGLDQCVERVPTWR